MLERKKAWHFAALLKLKQITCTQFLFMALAQMCQTCGLQSKFLAGERCVKDVTLQNRAM